MKKKNIDYFRIISLVAEIVGGRYLSAKTVHNNVNRFATAFKADLDQRKLDESRKVWNKLPKPKHFAYH